MDYKKRITDELLKIKLEAFGAALIVGPKGCGKTTTAKQIANTVIEFEDEDNRESLLKVAETMPSKLLKAKNQFFLMNGKTLQRFGALLENQLMIQVK